MYINQKVSNHLLPSFLLSILSLALACLPVFADETLPSFEEVSAIREIQTQTYEAVGTVKPCSEIRIESQVNAQVKTVQVQAGARVNQGQLLLTLDERQALSRLDGAKASLNQAVAARKQALQAMEAARAADTEARLQYNRVKKYYDSQAATKRELEVAQSAHDQAKAGLKRAGQSLSAADSGIRQAKELLAQAKVAAGFCRIKAPASGEVIRRLVEPGDLALPGKPLMILRTESGFRMEAHVREGLIHRIAPGMKLTARIMSLGVSCEAVVEEVIPYADPETRTFLIKALLPEIQGIYPGMYGKLLIPEETRQVVMIPKNAVIYTGQLELVRVKTQQGWSLRYITTGNESQGQVEVLSGLSGKEILGVPKNHTQGEQ